MSKTLTFEKFCKDNNYYYGNMAITSLKDNTLTSIPKVVDEYFKAKVESITDEVKEMIHKSDVEMNTLLKVIQHKDSSEDDITRSDVARRFVKSKKEDLLKLRKLLEQ